MGRYMVQASYTQQGISGLVQNPEDRTAVLQALVSGLGGTVHTLDYCFGDYDLVLIMEAPDDVAMAALSMAVGASGAVTNIKTTVLIPAAQGVEAAKKVPSVNYRPPGS